MALTGDVHPFYPDTCSSFRCVNGYSKVYTRRLVLSPPTVYKRSSSDTRGTDTANISEGAEDAKQTLLYIPSKDIIRENLAKLNPQFSKWVKLWSKGQFVSMVIPKECDNEILASETGTAFGAANKGNTYDVYRSLITDCLVGTGKENNPTRLLKLAMICSHPDSTLAILKASGLIQEGSSSSDSDLTRPEGIGEGEEIPLDKDPRLAKSLTFHPEGGERLTGPWGLSDEGLDAYFKVCYLVMLTKYQAAECLDDGSYQLLVQWVESDGFLDAAGEEYNAALNALKASL